MIPTAAQATSSEVPPAETNGSVIPVAGKRRRLTAMWTAACPTRTEVRPAASSEPNSSEAVRATS